MNTTFWERIQKSAGTIFIILIIFLIIFVFLDIASRKFLTNRSPIEKQFSVSAARYPQPYTMFGGLKYAKNLKQLLIPGSLNRLGYKGPIPEMPKSSNEYRIIFLGGSTVLIGQPSIPELLEQIFKDNGLTNVKVYNFGVISSVSGQEVVRIVTEISNYNPDLIVMYNGANDILSPLSGDPRPGYPFNFIAYENNPLLDKKIDEYPLFALMAYASNILRATFPSYFIKKFIPLNDLRKETGWKTSQWEKEIAESYVSNIRKARQISKAFGSEFFAFFQPTLYYKDKLDLREQKILNQEIKEFSLRVRKQILESIVEFSKAPDTYFYDISDLYDDYAQAVFFDQMHSFQDPRPVVAAAIYKQITTNIPSLKIKDRP